MMLTKYLMHMFRTPFWGILVLFFTLGSVQAPQSEAQLQGRFGKNKVHYRDFQWATLETPHFMLYFYQGEERLAQHASRMAERAYTYLSDTFQHQFAARIPLIVYASSDDFQQTEVIDGLLGEGVGGVTESLRGRIVLPFLGSYREFNHVLVHEIVHAFQFDILSEAGASLTFFSSLYLPLWFIEGMAEYLTEYNNPLTEMWLRDAVYHDTLPSAKKFDGLSDIRVYRLGEALIKYIATQYGDNILGDLLRVVGETEEWEESLETLTETSWQTIYEEWLADIQCTYEAETSDVLPLDRQADVIISHTPDDFFLNILPAISPDGQYVAFTSDRDFYRTIYMASADTGEIIAPLVEGERRGTYETLRFLNTSIAWAPDSQQIAFNARAGGQNAIYLLDIQTREVTKTLTPSVTSLSFLAWSPDGTTIVFTGSRNGQEDLFLITIDTGDMTQLTDDVYANRHPAWSPDGKHIAFTTDAGDLSRPEELQFGPSNLALYDLVSNHTRLLTNTQVNELNPVWSPDGDWIAYISDRSGVYNLYVRPVQRDPHDALRQPEFIQVTNVNTGIVGLTPDNPAVTWARDTGTIMFSGFSQRGWDILALENPVAQYFDYRAEVGDVEELKTTSSTVLHAQKHAKKDWAYPLPEPETAAPEEYRVRLQPDYIFAGGGGDDKQFIILARIGFSDMLSNHEVRVGGNFTEVLDESDFLIEYINQAHRLSYRLTAFQFDRDLGAYQHDDGELELDVERGIGFTALWPFDKFRRIEVGVEGRMVSGTFNQTDVNERPPFDDQRIFGAALAYVHDTTLYTAIGPLDGWRSRFGVYPAIGDVTYLTFVADHRRYWHLTKRSALAFRAMAIGSIGENARIFEIGGSGTFRGRQSDDDVKLRGTNVALGNIEYRFPLLPKFNILRGNIFLDTALVWDDAVQPFTSKDARWVRLKDLNAAYGVGLRVPIQGPFGVLNLRVDMVQETDFERNLGKRKVIFSIGNDF